MPSVGKRSEQQTNVYLAEAYMDGGRTFPSIEAAQIFVDSITALDWWRDVTPDVDRIDVVAQDGRSNCSVADTSRIATDRIGKIALLAIDEKTILHEIAHCLAPEAGHESPWVRELLGLTYRVSGSERYSQLYKVFVQGGVDVG